jgi:Domain of unknown function (DUF4145)
MICPLGSSNRQWSTADGGGAWAQWAHHVRLEGNDAAHDEDPFTKDEAEELLDFT